MKNEIFTRYLIAFGFMWVALSIAHADESVSLLVYGDKAAPVSDESQTTTTTAVFNEAEQNLLNELGASDIAGAKRVELENAAEAKAFSDRVKAENPNAIIETNSDFVLHSTISTDQWGLDNRGASQRLILDKTRSMKIEGVIGEDIGLTRIATPDPQSDLQAQDEQMKAAASPAREVRVAILDTGIDTEHPALKDAILRRSSECEAQAQYQKCLASADGAVGKAACDKQYSKLDTDGNGYALDCAGWNAVLSNGTMLDDRGHGTHVAGIVAARPVAFGIQGVNPSARIIPIRVTDNSPNQPVQPQDEGSKDETKAQPLPPAPTGKNLLDAVARGLLYAINAKADVINLSLAWPASADTAIVRRLVEIAIDRGITVVSSAGNDSTESRVYPCQYDRVICVASHSADGKLSYFSNYGSSVDVVAPGHRILSTWPTAMLPKVFTDQTGYDFKNGTSMASPMVAGAASVLRSLGFSERETASRLVLGARAQNLGNRSRSTRFGNLDLAQSLSIAPRGLVLPLHKAPLIVQWDGSASKIEVQIPLKNEWAAAETVEIATQILDEKLDLSLVHAEENMLTEEAWTPGEERSIRLHLSLPDALFPGRLFAELKIKETNESVHTTLVPIEIVRNVSKAASSPEWIRKLIRGEALTPDTALRTLVGVDGPADETHYIAVRATPTAIEVSQLVDEKDSFVRSATGKVPVSKDEPADLLLAQAVDVDLDGEPEVVLLFNRTLKKAKKSVFEFRVFDRTMKENDSLRLTYDNLISVIPENFKWVVATAANEVKRKVPAWFAFGSVPTVERSNEFDPWNPAPRYSKDFRLYYLAADGARSVPEVNGLSPVTLLSGASASQPAAVLLADNRKLPLKYFTATLENGLLSNLQPYALSQYRSLLGLDDVKPVIDLEPREHPSADVIFTGPSGYGHSRSTLFSTQAGSATPTFELNPAQNIDSVYQALAAFRHTSPFGTQIITVSLSLFDIVFQDHANGSIAALSQNRFSYMANLLFQKTFFPLVAATETGDLSPAVMIPPGVSGDTPLEIVQARLSSSGAITEVLRPAYYRFSNSDECSLVGNAIRPDAAGPSRLVYQCRDEIIQIPLTQKPH